MGRLVYSVIASLDGFVNDESGGFEWAEPSEEVHRFANDLERTVGTSLYGRRMYEVMSVWQDWPGPEEDDPVTQEYAGIWRDTDKVVFSSTLPAVTTPRTTLERTFDPTAVRALVDASQRDVSISGPTLAAHALRAGIVDEIHVILVPVVVGGGTPCWPNDLRVELELLEQGRFTDGTTHTHYRLRG